MKSKLFVAKSGVISRVQVPTRLEKGIKASEGEGGSIDLKVITPEGKETPVVKEKTISANGTYEAKNEEVLGYSKVVVNVPSASIQDYRESSIESNGSYVIVPDTGYTAMGHVNLTVNVPTGEEMQEVAVNYSTLEVTSYPQIWDTYIEVPEHTGTAYTKAIKCLYHPTSLDDYTVYGTFIMGSAKVQHFGCAAKAPLIYKREYNDSTSTWGNWTVES